jgi:F1F0 ATPase subunit 2
MDAQAMTKFLLAQQDLIACALAGGAWLAAGAAVGALYFLTLHWNVRKFAAGRSPVLALALALQLARFAALAGVLAVVAVHFGALPLLVATAGILAARTVFLRWGVRS